MLLRQILQRLAEIGGGLEASAGSRVTALRRNLTVSSSSFGFSSRGLRGGVFMWLSSVCSDAAFSHGRPKVNIS